jgi:hypothetical protein
MKSDSDLIEEYFINIPIPGLGDCFYETLRLYGKLYNVPQLNQTVLTLRKYALSEIMEKSDTNEQFQIVLSGIHRENLNIIKKKEQFLNDANIAAVQLAYRIFNVNIVFYNVDANGIRIDRYPEMNNPRLHTIHIIRKDDIHFELLIPIGDPIQVYGFAEMIRDARLAVEELEVERDTLIALIVDGQVKRTQTSVNKEFNDRIRDVRAEQGDAIQQASELMVYPEHQQAARDASMRVQRIFNRNHIANLTNAIQQLRVERNSSVPFRAEKLAQEESNAAFAKKLAEEESNVKIVKKRGPKIALKIDDQLFAAKLAQEDSNAAFAASLAEKPKKKGPRLPPKKGGTRKRRGYHMRITKKLKKRSV